MDWTRVLELINDHGITTLAAYNIRNAGLEKKCPENVIKYLNNGSLQNIARNSWLTQKWLGVNDILVSAGIKHLLLKGMALEHTKYGGIGLRQMADTDILVKKDEALKAWGLLKENGFIEDNVKSRLHKKILLDIGYHLPALRKDGYIVEVHHRLFSDPAKNQSLDFEIDNSTRIMIAGSPAYTLRDEIHADFLYEHMKRHMLTGEFQLRMYADLTLFGIEKNVIIPKEFINKPKCRGSFAYRSNRYRMLFYSMPKKSRFRFWLGDVFVSVRWIMNNYKCSTPILPFCYFFRLLRTAVLIFPFSLIGDHSRQISDELNHI